MESVMVPPGMGIVEEVDCALILCQMWVVLPILLFLTLVLLLLF
jgi:hypothetical protein